MLGNKKGKMICGYVPDYVLFDLETTGTSCIYDEVIEISAVKVRSGKVVESLAACGIRKTDSVCREYG
ncbi:MAG: exonuclease domain-containing protein [[Clostridium] symbiosum]